MVYQQAEGFLWISLLQELDSVIGGQGGRIALLLDILPMAKARGFWDNNEPCLP